MFFTVEILLNLFYLVIAIFWDCAGFKRLMFPKPEAPGGYEEVKLACQYGNIEVVTSDQEDLYDQVVNVFFGFSRDFNGKITVDGHTIFNTDRKDNKEKKYIDLENDPDTIQIIAPASQGGAF